MKNFTKKPGVATDGSAEESSEKKAPVAAENGSETEKKAPTSAENALVLEREARIAELTVDIQRLRADFENYRKQSEAQQEQAKKIEKFATVVKILPMVDDMDRAIASYPEELGALGKTLEKTMRELGLEKIATEAGTEFDPEVTEAVMIEDGEGEREVVAETLRAGYRYEGEVARVAMVKVRKEK